MNIFSGSKIRKDLDQKEIEALPEAQRSALFALLDASSSLEEVERQEADARKLLNQKLEAEDRAIRMVEQPQLTQADLVRAQREADLKARGLA